jgi:hypothetical protein
MFKIETKPQHALRLISSLLNAVRDCLANMHPEKHLFSGPGNLMLKAEEEKMNLVCTFTNVLFWLSLMHMSTFPCHIKTQNISEI